MTCAMRETETLNSPGTNLAKGRGPSRSSVSLAREYGQENARGRVLPACQLIKIRTALREPGFREGRGSSNDALTQRQPERIELRR